jgi:hypothetical protein
MLQNKPEVGNFTFSASLYSNGEIVFAYYFLPIDITKIEDGESKEIPSCLSFLKSFSVLSRQTSGESWRERCVHH